ncbi:MAG: sulfatase [Thermogemmata sp.]|nr:MAG: N-acetylgalactosamine-6-sulfatase [Gemmataceae bacterium]
MRCVLLTLLVWLLGSDAVWATGPIQRPNIVFLLADDLGYGDLACYGHSIIQTPHLDKLAAEGMKLTHCYAAMPVCSPSRAAILTGRIPHRYGIREFIGPGGKVFLPKTEITVATLLKSAGYRTGFVGKWHLCGTLDGSQPTPGDHGFDFWFATQNNARPSHRNPNNFVRNGQEVGPLKGYSAELVVQEGIEFIQGVKDQPFVLFVWFHEPHVPLGTAEEFLKLYEKVEDPNRRLYYGNVSQLDAAVGRLLKALDDMNLRDKTLIFFTSDNGPEKLNAYPGCQACYGSAGPFRGMKLSLYEGGIRVPGIIRWPGRIKPGTVCTEPISGVDFLPTLCEVTGVTTPQNRAWDGVSILPVFEGKSLKRTTPLYWQYQRTGSPMKIAIRQGPWKLLSDTAFRTFELYHLLDDEKESKNLAEAMPERVKAMADVMRKIYGDCNERK